MGKDLGNPASLGGKRRNKSDDLMDAISKHLPWGKFGGRKSTPRKISIWDLIQFRKGGEVKKTKRF